MSHRNISPCSVTYALGLRGVPSEPSLLGLDMISVQAT